MLPHRGMLGKDAFQEIPLPSLYPEARPLEPRQQRPVFDVRVGDQRPMPLEHPVDVPPAPPDEAQPDLLDARRGRQPGVPGTSARPRRAPPAGRRPCRACSQTPANRRRGTAGRPDPRRSPSRSRPSASPSGTAAASGLAHACAAPGASRLRTVPSPGTPGRSAPRRPRRPWMASESFVGIEVLKSCQNAGCDIQSVCGKCRVAARTSRSWWKMPSNG